MLDEASTVLDAELELASVDPWSAYIVECADGSLYCGVAKDVKRRIKDHGTARGAKYVRGHGGVKRLLWQQKFTSQNTAMRAEIWIKSQTRKRKLALVDGRLPMPDEVLS